MTVVATQEAYPVDKPAIEERLLKDLTLIVVGVARQELPMALLGAVQTVWFEGVSDGHALFSDEKGSVFQVVEAPVLPLAILADPGASPEADTLYKWLHRQDAVQLPSVVGWARGRESEAISSIVALVAEHVKSAARRLVLSNRELRTLRNLNDDLQNRFAAIESFLNRHGLQPLDLVFSNEPAENPLNANVLASASRDGISQILPVPSSGVSGVSVHLDQPVGRQDLKLRAQLVTLEDLRIVDTWQISSGDLTTGWNIFGLSKSTAGLNRTLEFRLQVEDADEDVPLLSLGSLQPIEMFQVRDAANGMPVLKNSLALQVWGGIPGVSMPPSANYIPAQSQQVGLSEGFRDMPIAPGILEHASLANTDEVSFDFEAIMPLPAERAIGCHPPAEGITIGELPAACPPQIIRMSAKAFIDNSRAADIDFAIAVAGNLEAAKALFREQREQTVGEAFSGWKTVSFGESAHLSAFASEQVGAWQNVYFATRMNEAGGNDFAWAKFANFRAVVNG
ncbi:MAG: DUF6212 domain-containing protein [Roseibium album]|uniref:Uncharacterized protein n=1 Tax=Roseibium album TaxID=311410 RepID=A0A0M7A856_9HYPH|nr:DUF6212 domain-containing protein [Roseibium album]MBG6159168.1 hypothetical protein [Labrenzia sp. EL_162]MBG6197744.1 hypothetical protein [Labrenzia sp. EL_159]MCR9055713.1 DUF6212 domain-containing protein [Paracoccaceae bacterium]CTQ57871.1 hypothetical protein LA5094_00628 [Roseibium album]CTQ68039.1 hypothetical protein LA5095_01262 [Roseibium album]